MVLAEHADLIFTLAEVFFSVALLPSLLKRSGAHMPTITSAATAGLLFLWAVTFIELGFVYSAGVIAVSGVLWVVLMYQRLVYLRRYFGSYFPWVRDMVTRIQNYFK